MVVMRLDVKVDDKAAPLLAARAANITQRVTAAVAKATALVKQDWRQRVTAALGARLGRSIRGTVTVRPGEAVGRVWTRAPMIIRAHATGAVIRGRSGGWLAIPLPAARLGGIRVPPGELERRLGIRLRHVYRRGQPSLLVAEGRLTSRGQIRGVRRRARVTVPLYVLRPVVRLAKRLELATVVRQAELQLRRQVQEVTQ